MPKITAYPAKTTPNRGDEILGVNNSVSPVKTTKLTHDNLVAMVYGGIGFSANAVNSGAIGTTWTVVDKWSAALAEKGFSSTPANNYVEVPAGEGGTYEIVAMICALNDTGERIFNLRLTKNGTNIAGTAHEFSVPAANRPGFGSTLIIADLAAADRIRVEVTMAAPAATTGNVTFASGKLMVRKVRAAA